MRREWRELGFFYDLDNEAREWRLVGSLEGLLRFRDLLLAYVANPRKDQPSEHEHFGPYSYLEVMTWPEAGFDNHSIHGSLKDLATLASLIDGKLLGAIAGSVIRIRDEFAAASSHTLVLDVREPGFDPASADPLLSVD